MVSLATIQLNSFNVRQAMLGRLPFVGSLQKSLTFVLVSGEDIREMSNGTIIMVNISFKRQQFVICISLHGDQTARYEIVENSLES